MSLAEKKRELEARLEALGQESEEARVAREQRETADLEALVAAIEKYGANKVLAIETDEGTIIVKRPNHLHFRRFMDADASNSTELEKLVRPCVVYPAPPRLDAILEELPASLNLAANAVVKLAGHRSEAISGK